MLAILGLFDTVSMIVMKEVMQHTLRGKVLRGQAILLTLLLIVVLLLVCSGCSSDNSRFVGIWDLQSMEGSGSNQALTSEEIKAMRELGFETYLNVDEDGSLTLVNFDKAQRGSWSSTGQNSANATIDGQQATILIEDENLRLTQQGVTLVFAHGDNKDQAELDEKIQQKPQDNSEEPKEIGVEHKTSGLCEIVVRGSLFDEPRIVVDDDICTIVIDGVGVDKWGDPGLNLQITNNSSTNIDVWVKDIFAVEEKPVRAYLCETVSPHRNVTSFIQLDTADLGSTSVTSLRDVTGIILVDNNEGVTIARYQLTFSF